MRFPAFFALFLGLMLSACSSTSAVSHSGSDGGEYVYVCNQGEATVAVIDTATLEVVETLDLQEMGYSATAKPHHVVVEPDGSFWYLSLIGENRVLKFNRENEVVGSAEFAVPGMMALHPDGERLFVGRSMSAVNPPQSIGEIHRDGMEIDEIEVFFPRPHAIAVSADGRYVFSASLAENRMIAIDLESGDGTFSELDGPTHTLVQFAAAPDGKTLIVGGQLTGKLLLLDLTALPEVSVRGSVSVESQPWHPVFGADGRLAYFGNKTANVISVVDTESGEVVKELRGPGIAQPHGSGISSNGRYVFISNQHTSMDGMADMGGGDHMMNGTVVVVDTQNNEIAKVIEVGRMPSGVGARGVSN